MTNEERMEGDAFRRNDKTGVLVRKYKGKKLTQVVTLTPIKNKRNRKGSQKFMSKTTYIKNA